MSQTAHDVLAETIAWEDFVKIALGDADNQPNPRPLIHHLSRWSTAFQVIYDGAPVEADFPEPVRFFFQVLASVKKGRGRPRCDQRKLLAARNAWETEVFRTSYKTRKDTIAFLGRKEGVSSCFGFDKASMKNDRPSALAIEKIADETGKSENYILDILFPRRHK